MKRMTAIALIWLGCAIAWAILGSTLLHRTGATSASLSGEVQQLWGPPLLQAPPRASYVEKQHRLRVINGVNADVEEPVELELPLVRSDLAAQLKLAQRKKGLVWFPTYAVEFHGQYEVENDTGVDRAVTLRFPLSREAAVYDGFEVRDDGGAQLQATIADGVAEWRSLFRAGEHRKFSVRYASRGTESWGYQPAPGTGQVRAFRLSIDTDFAAVDFPVGALSPSLQRTSDGRWHGEWTFSSLVASQSIGVVLPQRLNPGPLASMITFFAPIGLLFFFFVVTVLAAAQHKRLHPTHYFFLGCAFFAFHLLFGYLVDHVAIAPSFAVASLVSLALVVSYARLFVGWRFALREMAGAQLCYLVLFSFSFFWSGFTGLAITIGAIVTLAVMMQVTGRLRWDE
jgi:hypothetical protein